MLTRALAQNLAVIGMLATLLCLGRLRLRIVLTHSKKEEK
jgi:hypothetical protein